MMNKAKWAPVFLNWLAQYLAKQGVRDTEIWQTLRSERWVLQQQLRQHHHPTLHLLAVHAGPLMERIRRPLKRIGRPLVPLSSAAGYSPVSDESPGRRSENEKDEKDSVMLPGIQQLNQTLRTILKTHRHLSSATLQRLKLDGDESLIRIPTRLITDDFGFSLAPNGWHYFRALVAEYERNPNVMLENTTFFRFFQDERVRSVRYLNDLLFLHDPEKRAAKHGFQFYFGTYPWGDWTMSDSLVGGNPFGYYYDLIEGKSTRDLYGYRRNPWYQPGDVYPIKIEWNHTIDLYNSLRKGYSPLRFGSFPSVVLLIRYDGEMRAVRYEGHHRLTILSHLGYDKLTVAIRPESIRIVNEAEVEQWYYVKSGLCTREQALEIFYAFFELNGSERMEYLGLPRVY